MATNMMNQQLEQLFEGMNPQEFIDQIPGHVFIKSIDGVYLGVNKSLENYMQLDLVGKTDLECPWKDDAPSFTRNDKEVMETKQEKCYIEKGHVPGKGLVTMATAKAPLLDKQGNLIGMIGHAIPMPE